MLEYFFKILLRSGIPLWFYILNNIGFVIFVLFFMNELKKEIRKIDSDNKSTTEDQSSS